jgi:two-component system chemotaxis sensor kinase CheA
MDVRQYADLFLTESREHLTAFNHLLLEWEKDPAAAEPVGGIFRAVHTIKGMAATMGYAQVAELAHRAENLLDAVRRGEKEPTPALIELLFRAADALERSVSDAVAGRRGGESEAALLAELDRASGVAGPARARGRRRAVPAAPAAMLADDRGRVVRVTLKADASLKGARALLVLKKAESLGSVSGVVPAMAAIEAEGFDGKLRFRLETDAEAAAVEAALRAVGDVETVEVTEPAAEAAPEVARARHVRVDLRRLDELMNLIGELVIARGRLATITARLGESDLDDAARDMGRLAGALQREIIQARMTPVWQVFDRFPRMVRDLARQMGKQVAFRVEGKEIELDRAILDEIAEPLVHLLRNAVDHGVEPPSERAAAGKPAVGQVVLAAVRERSSVAIRVSDDGRGVNRAEVLRQARQMGLVEEHQELGDDELFRLLARSGFSTAAEVTAVSGRGVGIDVVATAARSLGGSLEIRSQEGRGTIFTIRLPVTLAIVRALLARVGEELYAVPLTHVAETLDPRPGDIRRVQGKDALLVRGRLLPLVNLGELVGAAGAARGARAAVIVLEVGERRTGVVVDALAGQQEIVVKGFEAPRGMLPIFNGATILGDGAPALILDAGGLV